MAAFAHLPKKHIPLELNVYKSRSMPVGVGKTIMKHDLKRAYIMSNIVYIHTYIYYR